MVPTCSLEEQCPGQMPFKAQTADVDPIEIGKD